MIKTAKLEVRHDGIKANAMVLVDVGEPALRACSLDAVIEAALQQDADLASDYAAILARIAPELYVVIRKEIDGSADNGCSWYAVELTHGINGDVLTTRRYQFGSPEFRGWNPTDAQAKLARKAILDRAAKIGLGNAQFWFRTYRTVNEMVAANI